MGDCPFSGRNGYTNKSQEDPMVMKIYQDFSGLLARFSLRKWSVLIIILDRIDKEYFT